MVSFENLNRGRFLCMVLLNAVISLLIRSATTWWYCVLFRCLLLTLQFPPYAVGHYNFGIKCVKVCTCVSKLAGDFLHDACEALHIGEELLLHTWYLFMVASCVLLGIFVLILHW